MKSNKTYLTLILVLIFVFGSSLLFGQVTMTVNSLADDEYAYAWDDPNTTEDESIDGICRDEKGRCTLRAAIDESNNMSTPLELTFSVSGTINLIDILSPEDESSILGGGKIELSGGKNKLEGVRCFQINNFTLIDGFQFNNSLNAIDVIGDNNVIGFNRNVFINCYGALVIEGDNNLVDNNYFGLDTNDVLGPNAVAILIIGSNNIIGGVVGVNTICGSTIAGISISEGSGNIINSNIIGTTILGKAGYGNNQGIVIGGSDFNIIGSDDVVSNIISGNTTAGIIVSGAPPESYSDGTIIKNNIIGLDYLQRFALPNGIGIVLNNGVQFTSISGNTIAGNSGDGISIFGLDVETKTSGHVIADNRIGIDFGGIKFPNGRNGIDIYGNVEDVIIGTNVAGNYLPNLIVGSKDYGIFVSTQFGYSPSKITARKNLIYQNNDANLTISAQSNNAITPPYSLSFSNNTIAGIHDLSNVIIDIYKADINEFAPSAYQWLGSTTAGANGVFSYEINDATIEAVSLTATTSTGNTSGFAYLELITAIREAPENIPADFSLQQNYPNPFNPVTTIAYAIPVAGFVSLIIYNELGEIVTTLINREMPAGFHSVQFDGHKLSSGIYFYKLVAGDFTSTKKMILIE